MVAYVETDNAYVKGDITFVSSKVPGYVEEILIEDIQKVSKGDVLLRIDPIDYTSAMQDSRAALEQARASVQQIAAQHALQRAQIRAAEAGVTSAIATDRKSASELARNNSLVEIGAVSSQQVEGVAEQRTKAASAVAQARAQAEIAKKQIGVLDAQSSTAQAQLTSAQARLRRSRADLVRTTVRAPREGRVAARNVRVGEFVNPGTRLLAITPTTGLWIEANLRETQLSRVHKGDRVEIDVDAIPSRPFCGTVEGYQGASGSEFAVIPPDNATGNFTKIVRRFTVRILLDDHQPEMDRLAIGMSVTPRIAIGSHTDGRSHGGLISWLLGGGSFSCGKAM
ncbi:HlyD family secretion protein [Qipengyuania sp. GH25]|uniref:HlyD family secretion protein n=1 Tax=Qipengyuania pacifica TaxID=2860199 RepID=A0ABS7JK94_9SPHN|nr:HlyD family secretion protein [Qipengyuania aerophila]MBX7489810.1 HlyD family secretion protein [Qipengyuania aerophila]